MTTQEFLKANRKEVISSINSQMFNQGVDLDLKKVMFKVLEYSQLGCYDVEDQDDLDQIIKDAVQDCEKERFEAVMKEGTKAENYFDAEREKVMNRFNQDN